MSKRQIWPRVGLKDVCESIVDCVNKTAPTVDCPTDFKMIRTTNVKSGWIDLSDVKYVTQEVFARWTRRAVPKKGDVILTREAPLGEVGMIRTQDKVFLGQRLVQYRADPKYLDNKFLLYAFQENDLQSQIKAFGSGATVEHMRVPDAERLTLKLPPLPIQRTIASILSAYDDLIDNNTRRIAILEEMAQMLYQEWFVKFRFPGHEQVKMGESELGMIPEGWRVKKLGEVIELAYGKALKASDRVSGNVPVYGSAGIAGYHDEKLVDGPGIIVGRKGNIGSVFWSDNDFYPIDTVFYVRSALSLYYLYYNLRQQHFINNDAAVPGLNRHQASLLPFLEPLKKTLDQFEAVVKPLFADKINLTTRNSLLRRTRDLLLPKIVSGEIDVSSWVGGDGEEAARELAASVAGTASVYESSGRARRIAEAGPIEPIERDELEWHSLWE